MLVFKFGGASVKDADSIRHLKKILDSYEENIIIVVSAMGKMTNALEELCHSYYYSEPEVDSKYKKIKEYHQSIINTLFPSRHEVFIKIEKLFDHLRKQIKRSNKGAYDYEYDQIVSFGELLSTTIITDFLNLENSYCKLSDIRDLLKTDKQYRAANVNWELTENLCKGYFTFADTSRYITQGFIGGAFGDITTTLGREGSDYTAAIIASTINADKVIFWKDVPGILNADPAWFDNTLKIDNISYREAIELSFYGAKIIHPKTIKPLQNKNIPLYIKPFSEPHEDGTVINSESKNDAIIPSFIFKMDQTLISISPRDLSFILEDKLSEIFGVFAELDTKINLMQTSAINFSVCIDTDSNKTDKLIEKLKGKYKIFFNKDLELATIRHYDQQTIDRVIKGKVIFLEQKTRNMARYVMK